ncbi:hypothetical protein JX265_014059 [Neoarthrinium moseri]|uniref:DUF3295 domain-containing protein n=1 Tax=Neoarthrinium moseri TaxID=1658444 RepID=A0A9Q0AHX8_9PEZI|nr:hypothetical protein JX265_014059 [Neoarthrinium moseri]
MNITAEVLSSRQDRGLLRYYEVHYGAIISPIKLAFVMSDILWSDRPVFRRFLKHCIFASLYSLNDPDDAIKHKMMQRDEEEWNRFLWEFCTKRVKKPDDLGPAPMQLASLLQGMLDSASCMCPISALETNPAALNNLRMFNFLFNEDSQPRPVPCGSIHESKVYHTLRQCKMFKDDEDLDVVALRAHVCSHIPPIQVKDAENLPPHLAHTMQYTTGDTIGIAIHQADFPTPPRLRSETQEPLNPATEPMYRSSEQPSEHPSEDTESSELTSPAKTPTVIRGSAPSQIRVPSSYCKSQESIKVSESHTSPVHKSVQSKRQPAKSDLDGSGGESSCKPNETGQRKKTFLIGGSSRSKADSGNSLKGAMHSARSNPLLSVQKEQASLKNQVTTRTFQTPSDQSNSYMDSAIDDSEDSEWEDSIDDSPMSSIGNPTTFKRALSKPSFTSRRSLISLRLADQKGQSTQGLSNHVSQSTSAISQRAGTYLNRGKRLSLRTPATGIGIPRSTTQPIPGTALSPATTRRTMLCTELTMSLQYNMIWERHFKDHTAKAVLRRLEKPDMGKDNARSWNHYLAANDIDGYNTRGW